MLSTFSCAFWPSVCLLWRNVCLDLQPFFRLGHYFFDIELHELFVGPILLSRKLRFRGGEDFPRATQQERWVQAQDSSSLTQSYLLSASPGRVTQSLIGHLFVEFLPCTPAGFEDTAGPWHRESRSTV